MINYRALIITSFMLLAFTALVLKLFSIQISDYEYYALKAVKQQNKPQVVKAERGIIRDTNGEVLSFTQNNVSFFVDTRMMTQQKVENISKLFSETFGKSKKYYEVIIQNGIRNVCLERKVPMDKALALKNTVIEGLFYEEDFSRIYPYGSLASHVLGYVNKQIEGVEGIEKVLDKKLTGIDGNYVFERDVMGRIISVNDKQSNSPIPGNNVILTINKTYQNILQEELTSGIEKYGGESAVGIIMNPNTGELLALANMPDFDPANYEIFSNEDRRNRALTDTYEPGSTIKSIVMSIMFDQKLVKENEVIDVENGKYIIKNAKITDVHPNDFLTVRQILEKSSNVGMAKLSTRIKDNDLYKYLRDFGFSNLTSIELAGEAPGYLKKPSNFNPLTKPFISFGYEISVTPLQMIAAFSALINGGILYKPFIVKAVTDSRDTIIEKTKPVKIRNVIDESTSDILRNMMVDVVEKGTGTAAQLENVLVGGKTGTSQKLEEGGYSRSRHNSSFVGYFPADNPQIICMILVIAPKVGKYGGLVAAPIFKNVAKRLLDADLNLAPDRKRILRKTNLMDQLITDIKNAPEITTKSFLNVAEKKEEKTSTRIVFSQNKSIMPDLLNYSMRDAVAQLNYLGLEYKVIGTGKVVEQSIQPGSEISPGIVCWLKCEPSKKINSVRIN